MDNKSRHIGAAGVMTATRSLAGSSRGVPKPPKTVPAIGIALILVSTVAAVTLVPSDPGPAEALFWPASFLAAGILAGPALRAREGLASALRAENLLMVGLVYWLLLDPLQGAYPFYGISVEAIKVSFTAIGIFAATVWLGAAGRGWRPPAFVMNTAGASIGDVPLLGAIFLCFVLGVFYFLWAVGFDLNALLSNLGKSRFAASWSRASLGDFERFHWSPNLFWLCPADLDSHPWSAKRMAEP